MKPFANLPPLDPLRRYSMNEGAARLSISRAHLYTLVTRGDLRTIKDGKRRFIPGTEIARLSTLPAAQ